MEQVIVYIVLVVHDYNETIEFYTNKLHLTLVEDTYQPQQDKRWVIVPPPRSNATAILFTEASRPRQEAFIGDQADGHVFLLLATNGFKRDYRDMKKNGIRFIREPKEADYGAVAVLGDPYGDLWDLVQFQEGHPVCKRL